jgi:hypothetical protein
MTNNCLTPQQQLFICFFKKIVRKYAGGILTPKHDELARKRATTPEIGVFATPSIMMNPQKVEIR